MDFASDRAKPSYAPPLQIVIKHSKIEIDATDIANRTVEINVTHTLEKIDKNANYLKLNAVDVYNLECSQPFVYDGKVVELNLSNFKDTVSCKYLVKNPIAGLYFNADPVHVIADHETERARHWLATVDYPNNRPTLEYLITHNPSHLALAQGNLIKSENGLTHYKLDFRTPSYLACFAVGDFARFDERDTKIPIAYFAPSNVDAQDLKITFGATPSILDWLEKKLQVPFPWPKYHQILSQGIQGGAMECPSLVTWNIFGFLLDETLAHERSLIVDGVNLHESAHSYFGDLVVCRHFEHSWLKESWATYLECVWLKETKSDLEFQREMLDNQRAYFDECSRYTRPIVAKTYDSSWTLFDQHLYPGGAWRLHMLATMMGDVFWKAVTEYLRRFSHKTVETIDFVRILEEFSGKSLDSWFDQWIYGRGYPKLKLSLDQGEGKWTIKAEQTQGNPWTVFDVTVPIFLDETQYELQFKDGKCMIQGNGIVKSIRVDPNLTTLFQLDFNPGVEILIKSTEAKDLRTKIWAFEQLVKIGSGKALDHVESTFSSQPYPVRIRIAESLSEFKAQRTSSILAKIIDQEEDPLALFFVIRTAKYPHPALREVLLKYLDKGPKYYRAYAVALESLGSQRNPQDLSRLLDEATNPKVSLNQIIACGAVRALGNTRDVDVVKWLRQQVNQTLHPRLTAAVMESLAYVVSWQSDQSLKSQVLEDLGRMAVNEHVIPFVRRSALTAMSSIPEVKNHLDVFEKSKLYFPEQDYPGIDRRMTSIRNKRDDVDLKKQVESLETRLKQLEEKLESKLFGNKE